MDKITCDVCGRPASVHITEIRGGQRVERNVCAIHESVSGIPASVSGQVIANGIAYSTVEEANTRGILDNLRGTANFARRHGRMPASVEELQQGMAVQDDVAGVEIAAPKVRAWVKWANGLIEFCQTHGRMPQLPDEIPPAQPGSW